MSNLTSVEQRFQTVWEDFTVADNNLYSTKNDVENVNASDNCKLVALNFARYKGYTQTAYGEGSVTTGLTEQQSFDQWTTIFNEQQRIVKNQLQRSPITKISQSVYDGLILYHWITGKLFYVEAVEGTYTMLDSILNDDLDTVASMIRRSSINQLKCIKASTVLRLADYGKNKNRTWMRTNGIHHMRDQNEKFLLNDAELKRARFAYYAETLKFLPFTPESIKRDIANKYSKTISKQSFTYSGSSIFTLISQPSMTPVEKLQVKVNGSIIQHLFDYTLGTTGSANQLTITKSLTNNDIIETSIKI
tara:strand:+ start:6641 stop:7555 length:915 start_codon:yes stop_codon:yes gene_type:complete